MPIPENLAATFAALNLAPTCHEHSPLRTVEDAHAIWDGFRPQLGEYWNPLWTLTVWSIVTAFILLIAAGVRSSMYPQVQDPAVRSAGRMWLIRGFGLTAIGLVVLVTKVSFHQHFNQNDLYHVIQWFGLYGVYRGGRTLSGI